MTADADPIFEPDVDATVAVVAHGLLNSMSIISGAASMLRDAWDALDGRRRSELLVMIGDQARHVTDMLTDLARGLPPGVLRELDALADAHLREGGRMS